MREVLMSPALIEGEKNELKPIEFTHYLEGQNGWKSAEDFTPQEHYKIVYLGKCETDGDMFVAYSHGGYIHIFKGNLNDGVY